MAEMSNYKGKQVKPTAEHHWNETYISGMSEHTEGALHKAYKDLEDRPVEFFNNCDETAARVHSVLRREGVKSRIVSGVFGAGFDKGHWQAGHEIPMSRDHVWLEVDNHVIDPTAGQFRGELKGKPFKQEHYWKDVE